MLILGVEPSLTAYKTIVRTDTLYERILNIRFFKPLTPSFYTIGYDLGNCYFVTDITPTCRRFNSPKM